MEKNEDKPQEILEDIPLKKCGIVMPISSAEGYPESHWKEVKRILTSAIMDAGFEARLVSEADDVGVIHQRIVQNLYDNPVIVCDISGKNPNVMFELGLRLAFDKPTIIVKDDITQYSFDTSVIEHLSYPKDLRYHKIENFKLELKDRIEKTYQKFEADPATYSTFLKNFGSFKVPQIDEKVLPINEYIIEELRSIKSNLHELNLVSKTTRSIVNNRSITSNRASAGVLINRAVIFFKDDEVMNINIARTILEPLEQVIRIKHVDTNYLEIQLHRPMSIMRTSDLLQEVGINVTFEEKIDNRAVYKFESF